MIDLLSRLLNYIVEMEEIIENEFGSCREFSELINDGDAPEIYWEVRKKIVDLESK